MWLIGQIIFCIILYYVIRWAVRDGIDDSKISQIIIKKRELEEQKVSETLDEELAKRLEKERKERLRKLDEEL